MSYFLRYPIVHWSLYSIFSPRFSSKKSGKWHLCFGLNQDRISSRLLTSSSVSFLLRYQLILELQTLNLVRTYLTWVSFRVSTGSDYRYITSSYADIGDVRIRCRILRGHETRGCWYRIFSPPHSVQKSKWIQCLYHYPAPIQSLHPSVSPP